MLEAYIALPAFIIGLFLKLQASCGKKSVIYRSRRGSINIIVFMILPLISPGGHQAMSAQGQHNSDLPCHKRYKRMKVLRDVSGEEGRRKHKRGRKFKPEANSRNFTAPRFHTAAPVCGDYLITAWDR